MPVVVLYRLLRRFLTPPTHTHSLSTSSHASTPYLPPVSLPPPQAVGPHWPFADYGPPAVGLFGPFGHTFLNAPLKIRGFSMAPKAPRQKMGTFDTGELLPPPSPNCRTCPPPLVPEARLPEHGPGQRHGGGYHAALFINTRKETCQTAVFSNSVFQLDQKRNAK